MSNLFFAGQFLTFFLLISINSANAQAQKLKPTKLSLATKTRLDIPEPSDAALDEGKNALWIVSDNGLLFKTRLDGTIIKTAPVRGYDFEGVFQQGQFVYVMEERMRRIYKFDTATMMQEGTYSIPYLGGRNKGFESLTYNPVRNVYITITEKDPSVLYELTQDFVVKNEVPLTDYPDVSSATFHNGKLWILSDEGRSVSRVNPATYVREAVYTFPIANPEGVFFDANGVLNILSDDVQTLYTINPAGL